MINKNPDIIEDDVILRAFQDGDQMGLKYLYDKYLHVIYGVCLRYFKNKPEAQDATSELFEKFLEITIPSDVQNLKTWLFVVTKNHCLMRLRKKRTETTQLIPEEIMDFTEELHPIDKALQKEQEIDALMRCIEALKDEQKQCIDMFYLKKQCYQDIVDQTGYVLKKVKSYIQNGKRNLKICLESNN